jgi:hypothetical protein
MILDIQMVQKMIKFNHTLNKQQIGLRSALNLMARLEMKRNHIVWVNILIIIVVFVYNLFLQVHRNLMF